MDSLESFRTVEKTSGQFGKFSDNHVICCSVFRPSGTIYALLYVVKTIYALLAHMSWTKFTHFVRKVFAFQSLPTGKLRLFGALLSFILSLL